MNGGTGTCENGTKYCIRCSSLPVRHERSLPHVVRDADHLAARHRGRRHRRPGRGFGIEIRIEADPDALADRALAGPHRARHGFVDDHDRRAAIVGGGQLAALDDADAEDVEELRRRRLQERQLAVDVRRLGAAGHGDRRHVEARERDRGDRRRGADAGNRAHAIERRVEQIAARAAGALLDVHDDDAVHGDAEVLREQVVEAAAEDAGAGQQQHRERRLQHEQRRLRARSACPPKPREGGSFEASRRKIAPEGSTHSRVP